MRASMVDSQLRTTDVTDAAVIAAMATVPRERFVPVERAAIAYADRPVPLPNGRALNPPLATARLLDALAIAPGDKVLLVGAATGYTAALLGAMGAQVVALEDEARLLTLAADALGDVPMITLIQGDHADGAAALGPFQAILIDGAVQHVPAALSDQLVDGGRLACAIDDRGVARLSVGRRTGGHFGLAAFADCEAAPLPGFAREKGFVF